LKNTLKSLLYLTALTAAMANIGSALTLANGSVGFNFSGLSIDTGGSLQPHTQFTVLSVAANNPGTGSFSCGGPECVALNSPATITSPFFGDTLSGLILTFGIGNRYTYTVTSQFAPDISTNGLNSSANIFTLGSFQDSGGVFSTGPASLVFAFTESCSGTAPCSISGSATFATPPADLPTPEPAALILTGSALLGLGFVRRKKLVK